MAISAFGRRAFIKWLCGAGVSLAFALHLVRWVSPRPTEDAILQQKRRAMGTDVTITVAAPDYYQAQDAVEAAYQEIERLEQLMSRFRPLSQVSQLNSNGFIERASAEVLEVFNKAIYYSRVSSAAFDITVLPVLNLYMETFSGGQQPTESDITSRLESVGYGRIEISGGGIQLASQPMAVSLDGVAKGYIVDRALEVLKQRGVEHGLIEAGGDIGTLGDKGDSEWKVSIRNPLKSGEPLGIIGISNRSIATSGDYDMFFDPERRFTHIIDPRSGHSPTQTLSVTVVADKAADADVLATTVFVLGPERGLELVKRLGNYECLILSREGEIHTSEGFDDLLLV